MKLTGLVAVKFIKSVSWIATENVTYRMRVKYRIKCLQWFI
jgi:hypothetical protein